MKKNINTYESIELWKEPSDVLKWFESTYSEMSSNDLAFLCGMIKQKSPNKIVEIGVAEGGTTAVIMNALSMLNLESEVYSVDLNENFYHDTNLKTGFAYERFSEFISGTSKQVFLLGKTIAGQIDNIGENIDFVILDTTHKLPGEILDFLCILPYLSDHATIILHDVYLNYWWASSKNSYFVEISREAIATKTLFTTVTADKYFNLNGEWLPNIASFSVNEDTYKYVADLFQSLFFTWSYTLTEDIHGEYRKILKKHYSGQCLNYFDMAVAANTHMLEKIKVIYSSRVKSSAP